GAVIDPRGYTHLASFELVDGVPRTLGGCQLDADTTVMVSIPLVHQRPELYPEPAPLRPERFLGHHPKPHEWVPFGGGARRCIGADLAMFEMKTVLATVLAEADLSAERAAPEHTRLLGTALRPSRRAAVVLAHPVS
ncbi:MAG: cytochrome P450, partial [Microbacteriaceae bacterium]